VVDAARQQHGAGGCQLGSLSSELSEDHLLARDALAASFTAWSEAIRAGLAAMTGNGTLPPETDRGQLALALLTAVQGGLLLAQAQHTTTPSKPPWTPSSRTSATTRQNPPGYEASTGPRTSGPGKRPAVAASCPGHGAWLMPGLQRADPRRRAGAGLLRGPGSPGVFRAVNHAGCGSGRLSR
jgi:hypothetical protein